MGRRGGDVLSISLHCSQSRYLRSEGWNHKNPIINFVFPSPPPFRRHDSGADNQSFIRSPSLLLPSRSVTGLVILL
jgi:hypothetical protein